MKAGVMLNKTLAQFQSKQP